MGRFKKHRSAEAEAAKALARSAALHNKLVREVSNAVSPLQDIPFVPQLPGNIFEAGQDLQERGVRAPSVISIPDSTESDMRLDMEFTPGIKGGNSAFINPFIGLPDPWGRPLSSEAAEAAQRYWQHQRAYENCDLAATGAEMIADVLVSAAMWRREYTRIITGLGVLPRGHRTYEPPCPPLFWDALPLAPGLAASHPGWASGTPIGCLGTHADSAAGFPAILGAYPSMPAPVNDGPLPLASGDGQDLFFFDLGGSEPSPSGPLFPAEPPPGKPRLGPAEPVLDPDQAALVDLIASGRNVFYTGSAGCGKSTVLTAFVKRLRDAGQSVHIMAPTGRAALEVNGVTTWSYAGLSPDSLSRPLEKLKEMLKAQTRKRFRETDVIVIDEVSMVENLHLERLNEIMKRGRGSPLPFGGVQVVVTGDFFQLPPVKPFEHCLCGRLMTKNDQADVTTYTCHGSLAQDSDYCCRGVRYLDEEKWAFHSNAWRECDFAHVELTTIHRQNDETFIRLLQKCRLGQPFLDAEVQLLMDHPVQYGGAVELYSTRNEVDRLNWKKMAELKSEEHRYKCLDYVDVPFDIQGSVEAEMLERQLPDNSLYQLQHHRYDRSLQLKVGMRVVLLQNLSVAGRLVNGSQGVVCGFEEYDPARMPRPAREDKAGDGQGPQGPLLYGDFALLKEQQIREFMARAAKKRWPVVHFLKGPGRVTIYAECQVTERYCGGAGGGQGGYASSARRGKPALLCRTQIPLMAAWAMSIHKAQGMTLDEVKVDLSKAFEEGQVYVALSRARSLLGLKIEGDLGWLRFGKGANRQVREFYERMFGGSSGGALALPGASG